MEAENSCSFFQSWAWIGCLAEERYPDPVLLQAHDDDRLVALALFSRRGSWFAPHRLWLGESGLAEYDSVFIEHNGILLANDAPADLLAACLRTALAAPLSRRALFGRHLILSGIDAGHVAAARSGHVVRRQRPRAAPFVDLTAIPASRPFLAGLSANTRYQIRRSDRLYSASGALHAERAQTVDQAHGFLDHLADLHQASWTRRGHRGAFAGETFRRFHRALIARAMPTGAIDLLCVRAADRLVGHLYNFRHRGRISAYQSGFDYAAARPHEKPGLTCHHFAIEMYRGEGMQNYDFLAGADRYKLSMANASTELHWIEVSRRWP